MMKILLQAHDLSEEYLRFAAQIGVDGFDIGPAHAATLPGVAESGSVDEAGLRALADRVRRWGLSIQRVAPPRPINYLLGRPGGDLEVDNLCRTLEALARVGVPFMSLPVDDLPIPDELGGYPFYRGYTIGTHRGGYTMAAFDLAVLRERLAAEPPRLTIDPEAHFERCVRLCERLLPIAEAHAIRLILHPSDPPVPDAPFSPERWARILDAVPSPRLGLLYCVGTRHEAGIDVFEDIRYFGERGKIFHVHFRNVRGTLPTNGGYAEVALPDGSMSMFRVVQSLQAVGYTGGLQVDHLPSYAGDNTYQGLAAAYAVAYIKGLLAALEA
jgi:mannonate dehydratase